ncbi:MAG: hypothetical protein OXC40_06275, partial [Proteobacteria bacterium]|nr:hypothetical protein [Pseudomonadota bacterium]
VSLLQYKLFYFFHSGLLPPSENIHKAGDEYRYFESYYEKIINQSLHQGHRTLRSPSSVASEINQLYASYSLAEMVVLIKQSNRLKEFVGVGLPYLTEKGYQIFEEEVLTTTFERHLFISYLLGIEKGSYLIFKDLYDSITTHTKFFKLVTLLKLRFFYFFHSGQLPSSKDFPSYNKEVAFLKSYYEKITR